MLPPFWAAPDEALVAEPEVFDAFEPWLEAGCDEPLPPSAPEAFDALFPPAVLAVPFPAVLLAVPSFPFAPLAESPPAFAEVFAAPSLLLPAALSVVACPSWAVAE